MEGKKPNEDVGRIRPRVGAVNNPNCDAFPDDVEIMTSLDHRPTSTSISDVSNASPLTVGTKGPTRLHSAEKQHLGDANSNRVAPS
ncbi:hypothetical protein P8C59_005211 [Phyllachora maydis]|uniref:Uncharacterized protein n=1 Tax=Phyllachora maydis TaxID=1825666 RepID=A0AAD9MB85_9PEZI|nr:hypothetical protein P8C59_005211 [Phyllachora maydis]